MSRNIVDSYAYDPFGAVLNQQEAVAQPFKYVGQYGVMAEPNGLYYMRARYYDPSVGRFISEDPLGFAAGDVSLYAYVQNDPENRIDPDGTNPVAVAGGVVGGAMAGPPGAAIGAGTGVILGGVIGAIIVHYWANKPCSKSTCKPCNPPVGTIGYRIDQVPPSRPHKPFPGTHVHLYKMNQNPNNCQCFWQPVGVTAPPPPPGAVPIP